MPQSEARIPSTSLPTPIGSLRTRLRVLLISASSTQTDWLAESLALDRATAVHVERAAGADAALACLRDDVFDAIIVTHEPVVLDALELVEAIRGLGIEDPVVVLGNAEPGEFSTLVYEIGGDVYLQSSTTSTRTLLWSFSRAIERSTLIRENRRLLHAEKNRLRQEQDDAQRLLADQRSLVRNLHETPTGLKAHYRELLRAHVIMGAGNLGDEIEALAQMLVGGNVSAGDAISLHLDVLEELVRGLGNRSARHVMARADLLALDLLSRLTESYRGR
jgi:DNA-binding response OmpR family regulator